MKTVLDTLYGTSLALLTDLYQLTMAAAHFEAKTHEREAVFHLTFRKNPFRGGFAIACGLSYVIDYLRAFRFEEDDLNYLSTLCGNDGAPLFSADFLKYLAGVRLTCDVDAIPEGTVVFPHEPLIRVRGPILQAQIFETFLINAIGFQTLIATKAARLKLAAKGQRVVEFGLRRAQGIDGGFAASRAAYIGGCSGTSNVLAGKLLGIPVKGTIAHSWVMAHESEIEAFEAYAKALPNNCLLLVDTYDTIQGVKNAIQVGQWLKSQGHRFGGIRLDSGDLAYLSAAARKLLDEAGFVEAAIVASNDLDEYIIESLKTQGAEVSLWAVGTNLVTAQDQPALGAVYKLSAISDEHGELQPRIKLSEQVAKISTPGVQQVRRLRQGDEFLGDVIYDENIGLNCNSLMIDPLDPTRRRTFPATLASEELLKPVIRAGKLVSEPGTIDEARARAILQLEGFHGGIKRFVNPHQYPVGLESRLYDMKTELILRHRREPE